jgi:hypothetical protein
MLHHRDRCDTDCDTCGSKHSFRLGWHKKCDDCTWTAPSCGCETCHESLFSKLKSRLHRSCDCGCEATCGGCGGDVIHTAPGTPAGTKAEPIGAPKETPKPLPKGDKEKEKSTDKGTSQVQVPGSPYAPTILEIDPKNPF